ncbi:uncharacterized protein GGS25DRAFT_496391 [Hypoxylon fragiforme]|uniref:uncharacterized protein n=1 Tax=Hypoxylon fragiforme TaxID=63214 RepID=UPI0020C626DC|nr:uncharacterized protein GGS25DRAFT_496391 [Hypoxylon fragiforme]KAI2607538.1 hypothetical protein GGS25DRAFT_496391 [Hypoxylon fragiforme]
MWQLVVVLSAMCCNAIPCLPPGYKLRLLHIVAMPTLRYLPISAIVYVRSYPSSLVLFLDKGQHPCRPRFFPSIVGLLHMPSSRRCRITHSY